ncbi:MAG: response regulator [Anaerolineales bacterium]|nr:response regulator [Anaerolineales bacterium]
MAEVKKIVIVEDEPDTAEMFAEMMRLSGYQVVKSYSGTRAIAVIAEEKPAAVVLDVMMPEFSGLDLLRYMRKDARLAKIPVVIVSAKGLPSDIQDGLEAGAASYLTKPVSFTDLKDAIEKAIRGGVN